MSADAVIPDIELGGVLPEGMACVPFPGANTAPDGDAPMTPLALCLVIRTAGPALIKIRQRLAARAFLACVADAAGRVHQWAEVWVQDVDGLSEALPTYVAALNNTRVDERWAARCALAERAAGVCRAGGMAGLVRVGWEDEHPTPMFLDVKRRALVRPVERGTGGLWVLCTDDALLARKGLAPYSTSLHRYLFVRELGEDTVFVPVTRGAPTSDRTLSPEETLGAGPEGTPDVAWLNYGAGLMLVCPHPDRAYEEFADALGSIEAPKEPEGTRPAPRKGPVPKKSMAASTLTLGRSGRSARLIETLHLKLRLLGDAFGTVRTAVSETQTPMLNLGPDSFGVVMGPEAWGLPTAWSARAVLRDAGDAAVLRVPGSEVSSFVGPGTIGSSVYSPGFVGRSVSGFGVLQIRQARTENGLTVVEGTVRSSDRVRIAASDLVWLGIQTESAGLVNLYGSADAKAAGATTEIRVRTVPQKLDEGQAQALAKSEGRSIPDVDFQTMPVLSTPCDLYALGVLAIRTLLVDGRNTLAVGLDEVQSLCAELAAGHDPGVGLGLRIRTILEGQGKDASERRWLDVLGPQHLTGETWEAADALATVTPEVWCDVLGVIARCFPAMGPDSVCRDAGDAPAGAIHRVLDKPLEEIRDAVVRTRGLLIGDPQGTREIREAIGKFLPGGAGSRR